MPFYRYQALSEEGKKMSAIIDAENLQDAKQKLIRQRIVVIQISQVSDKEMGRSLSKNDVLSLTREIARLLQAGLPLFEALSALEEKYRNHKAHKILLDLCEAVKTGQALSKALSRHPSTFDLLYVSMVANAEKTGKLGACLEDLSQLIARSLRLRKQVLSALLYPALLALFCLVVLASLLFFVIPSLQELFEGRALHPLTQIVFTASRIACESKILLVLSLGCIFAMVVAALCSRKWKEKIIVFACKLPFLKNLFAKSALIRFSRAFAALLDGGVSLIAALAQARTVMRHPLLEGVIRRAEEKIAQGDSLSSPFANHPLIPPLIPRMLGIAEQSGKLSFTMQQIAQIYEDELESTLTHFASLAQPALLLLLGGIVGFVLLSVLLPLTDVSSFTMGG